MNLDKCPECNGELAIRQDKRDPILCFNSSWLHCNNCNQQFYFIATDEMQIRGEVRGGKTHFLRSLHDTRKSGELC